MQALPLGTVRRLVPRPAAPLSPRVSIVAPSSACVRRGGTSLMERRSPSRTSQSVAHVRLVFGARTRPQIEARLKIARMRPRYHAHARNNKFTMQCVERPIGRWHRDRSLCRWAYPPPMANAHDPGSQRRLVVARPARCVLDGDRHAVHWRSTARARGRDSSAAGRR